VLKESAGKEIEWADDMNDSRREVIISYTSESYFLSNAPGFTKEFTFLGGSQHSPSCPFGESSIKIMGHIG
jgi:hypothetical protein